LVKLNPKGDTVFSKCAFVGIILLAPVRTAFPQVDSSKLEYFPLHIGDLWQYRNEYGILGTSKILGDTIISGRYYYVKGAPDFPQNAGYIRIDSLYRVVWHTPVDDTCTSPFCDSVRQNGYEYGIYRLNEQLGSSYDIWDNVSGVVWQNAKYIMKYVSYVPDAVGPGMDAMVFNPDAVDTVKNDTSSYGFNYVLVRGLGVYREEREADLYEQLTGAVINGVQWGTVVSIFRDGLPIPSGFILGQNYPNPFNSVTVIEFVVPTASIVKLELYNLLGQKMHSIFDDWTLPGRYRVSLDSGALTSGTYIYLLRSGGVKISRRMMIIK
jgi:hypothetical protein